MAVSETLARVDLGLGDLDGAQALSDAAGWNQTGDDWKLFIGHGHARGRRSDDGALVASGAALPYGGGQGWVSMVLVTPAWRHRGLATGLLDECVAWLRQQGLTPVLDATPAGAAVYRRQGFVEGFEFDRWERGASAPHSVATVALQRVGLERLDDLVALDAAACRVERRVLLESFLARPATEAWTTADGRGFIVARAGRRARQVGPIVAAGDDDAIALLQQVLAGTDGPVFLDVPRRCTALTAWLQAQGFRTQRPFVRMALGDAPSLHAGERLFAVAGPEFG